jgi:hypothetical protein
MIKTFDAIVIGAGQAGHLWPAASPGQA